MESSIGVDFAKVYNSSPLFQCAPRLLFLACPCMDLAVTCLHSMMYVV